MRAFFNLCVVLAFLFTGCKTTANVYMPTLHNTPLLEEKGESHLAAYTGTKGLDFHAAYALSKKIGIAATGSFLSESSDTTMDQQMHRYGELAATYSILEEQFLFAEVLVGAGLGTGKELVDSNTSFEGELIFAKGDYSKFSIQPNVAFTTDFVVIGISPKLSYLSFYNFKTTKPPEGKKMRSFFWEPAFFSRLGYKHVMIEVQVGSTKALHEVEFNYDGDDEDDLDFGAISIGIILDLNVFRKE